MYAVVEKIVLKIKYLKKNTMIKIVFMQKKIFFY